MSGQTPIPISSGRCWMPPATAHWHETQAQELATC